MRIYNPRREERAAEREWDQGPLPADLPLSTKEKDMKLIEHLEALRVSAQKAAVAAADPTTRAYAQGVADGLRNAILAAEAGPHDPR